MDENQFELAEKMAEAERNAGLAASRKMQAKETHPEFDGVHCVGAQDLFDCTEEVSKERLAMGRIRCTGCAQIRENIGKQRYGR